jgi:DNA-binding NtrC family response regulator
MTPETSSPFSILIIENDPADLNLLEDMLWSSQLKIKKLYYANRVQEAKRLLYEQAVDLVILELSLPDSSGIETFTNIQQTAYSIPVIILTGSTNNELALAAIKEGAQDFLIKGQVTDILLFKSIHTVLSASGI